MILRHMSGGRFKNRAEERTQMLQQLSHVRNGQAKKDEGLKQKQNHMYIYIFYVMYTYNNTVEGQNPVPAGIANILMVISVV